MFVKFLDFFQFFFGNSGVNVVEIQNGFLPGQLSHFKEKEKIMGLPELRGSMGGVFSSPARFLIL